MDYKYGGDETVDDTLLTEKTGMKFLAARDLAYNSKLSVLKLNSCFDYFVTGTGDEPEGEELENALYGPWSEKEETVASARKMPCFAHLPIPEDITDRAVALCGELAYFKKYIVADYRRVLSMIIDSYDGMAWVKVYRDEGGVLKPVFVKVSKLAVYFRWVLGGRVESLWTGLIREAFRIAGIAYEEQPRDERFYLTHFDEKSAGEYGKFVYQLYLTAVSTSSLHIQQQKEFTQMTIVIKRLPVYLPTLVDQPKENAAGVLGELKEIADAYMEAYRGDNDTRAGIRKNLCRTIFEFYEWYQRNDANSMRPYTLLMKKKK